MNLDSNNRHFRKDVWAFTIVILIGVGIPLGVFFSVFPYADRFVSIDPFLHMALMLIVGLMAGILAYVTYRLWQLYTDPYFFTFSLFLAVTAGAAIVHGIETVYAPFLSLHILQYMGVVILPLIGIREATLRPFLIMKGWRFYIGITLFFIALFVLLGLNGETVTLSDEKVRMLFVLGGIFPSTASFFFLRRYIRVRNTLFLFFGVMLLMWGIMSVFPLYYEKGDLLWWCFHGLFFVSVGVALFGFTSQEEEEVKRRITPFPFYSGIGTKVFLGFLLIAFLFSLIAFVSYRVALRDIRNTTLMNVDHRSYELERDIVRALDTMKDRAVDFSSDGKIRELTKKIIEGDTSSLPLLTTHLEKNKQPLDSDIRAISIYDQQGNFITSTLPSLGDSVTEGLNIPYGAGITFGPLYEDPFSREHPVLIAAAPLFDITGTQRIGVLVNYISIRKIQALIAEDVHQPSLSYMVDASDNVVVASQEGVAPVGSQMEIKPTRACRTETRNFQEHYRNSQGEVVTGAFRCLSNGWVTISEITETQSEAGLAFLGRIVLLATLIAVLLLLLMTWLITHTLVVPIKKMAAFAGDLAVGNLSKRINHFRQDEIGMLGTSLNAMADNIEKAVSLLKDLDRKKSEFVSIAAHQLRNTPGVIHWYLELLTAGELGKITPSMRAAFAEMKKTNDTAIKLIHDLLDVMRIEEGGIGKERSLISLPTIVNTVLKEFEPDINAKKLETSLQVAPDPFPSLLLNKEQAYALVANLASNAIKYNKKGGAIQISLTATDTESVVSITDTGIGIPKQEQQNLYTKFFRASNARVYEPSGTGLGLYIAKRYVEEHGGTIEVTSVVGKGSTFTVHIPRMEA